MNSFKKFEKGRMNDKVLINKQHMIFEMVFYQKFPKNFFDKMKNKKG